MWNRGKSFGKVKVGRGRETVWEDNDFKLDVQVRFEQDLKR